jgi:dipeptidase D
MSIKNLEPKALWNNFSNLNAVPRPSKKEERVRAFMVDFGKSLGLETFEDAIGNVIIKKKASPGMEDRQTVILQSHLDMVHQKNSDTVFDFDNQGIEMLIEGDWVKAKGTTLGADNGIGVAAIMAVLASTEIVHPAIEAMFTIDEETGMTGAIKLDPKNFSGTILLNLDTEDDDELSIGCAGGIDTNTFYKYQEEAVSSESSTYEIKISGLLGGHSGMDIHTGRGNANKIMNRILFELSKKCAIQISKIDGGSLRNAIPRESMAIISVQNKENDVFVESLSDFIKILIFENQTIEKNLKIEFNKTETAKFALPKIDANKIINAIYAVPNGVFRMSPDIEGLVEASSSLARVILENGEFKTQSLQRSSVESTKDDVANAVRAAFENIGCEVIQNGEYPGWKPNPDSKILKLMAEMYQKKFQEEPKIKACHAGLECGILGGHFPNLDMISFGPNIRAAHSPDEKVQISSVQKFWSFYLEILKEIPLKDY